LISAHQNIQTILNFSKKKIQNFWERSRSRVPKRVLKHTWKKIFKKSWFLYETIDQLIQLDLTSHLVKTKKWSLTLLLHKHDMIKLCYLTKSFQTYVNSSVFLIYCANFTTKFHDFLYVYIPLVCLALRQGEV